ILFHTPKQKLPVAGSRPEFMISVPSLCHWTYPASSVVPSGGLTGNGLPELPFATNVNFHSPTIVVITVGDRQRGQPVRDRGQKRPSLRRSELRLLACARIRSAIGASRQSKKASDHNECQRGSGHFQDLPYQVRFCPVWNFHVQSPFIE